MYMRSSDIGLGLPFNISSYSLMTYIFANVLQNVMKTKIIPGTLSVFIGNAHIYLDHEE